MRRRTAFPSLLAALVAVPLLAGCAVLGVPSSPGDAVPVQPDATAGIADQVTPGPIATPAFISSNDGYSLTLPAGWVGRKTNRNASAAALEALAGTDPALGAEARTLIGATGARLSMVGIDAEAVGLTTFAPGVAILVLSTDGATEEETQARIGEAMSGLTVAAGSAEQSVIRVPAGDTHLYQVPIQGDSLSFLLRVYLFTVGDDGILVLFADDPVQTPGAAADLAAIIKSLRFGV